MAAHKMRMPLCELSSTGQEPTLSNAPASIFLFLGMPSGRMVESKCLKFALRLAKQCGIVERGKGAPWNGHIAKCLNFAHSIVALRCAFHVKAPDQV